ncbi:MAG: hypothetical protein ACTSWN_04680 [Promethearchaeota archaeon]
MDAWRDEQEDMELFYMADSLLKTAESNNLTADEKYLALKNLANQVYKTMSKTLWDRWGFIDMREFSHDGQQPRELPEEIGQSIESLTSEIP